MTRFATPWLLLALFAVPLTGLAWSIYRARRETSSVSGAPR